MRLRLLGPMLACTLVLAAIAAVAAASSPGPAPRPPEKSTQQGSTVLVPKLIRLPNGQMTVQYVMEPVAGEAAQPAPGLTSDGGIIVPTNANHGGSAGMPSFPAASQPAGAGSAKGGAAAAGSGPGGGAIAKGPRIGAGVKGSGGNLGGSVATRNPGTDRAGPTLPRFEEATPVASVPVRDTTNAPSVTPVVNEALGGGGQRDGVVGDGEWVAERGGIASPPTGLTTLDRGDGLHVDLAWDGPALPNVTYKIERAIWDGSAWSTEVTVAAIQGRTTDEQLTGVGLFRFRVLADTGGGTAAGGWVQVTVVAVGPTGPGVPSGVTAVDIGNRRARVAWTAELAGATGYEIERSPAFPGGLVSVGPASTNYLDPCGAGSFAYHVRALASNGQPTDWSGWAGVSVAETLPGTPTSVTATDLGNERDVELSWTAGSNNETSFQIEHEFKDIDGVWVATANMAAAAGVAGATMHGWGGDHRYRVAAVNSVGTSTPSGWITVSVASGWTQFTRSADTRVVYVSSSEGNDANDGLTRGTAKRTIAEGKALIRNGSPDWLLLKRGDTWTDESIGSWTKSGRGTNERVVIASYGDGVDRPLLRTGQTNGFSTQYGPNENYSLRYLALTGVEFVAHTYNGTTDTTGVYWLMPGQDVLIEDCKFVGYNENFSIGGTTNSSGAGLTNLTIRRCVIADAYTTSGHSQGIYLSGVNSGLIEENVLDHNGWSETVSGAPATIFSRNMYFGRDCGPLTVRGNISANSGSEGLQLRSGGLCEKNLFLRNSTGVTFGQWQSTWPAQATSGIVRHNVVLDAHDIAANPRGFGIQLEKVDGVEVYGNIVAHQRSGTGNIFGIYLGSNFQNINVHDNIVYDWSGAASLGFGFGWNGTPGGTVRIADNQFQQSGGGQVLSNGGAVNTAIFTFLRNTYFSTTAANQWFSTSGLGTTTFADWVVASGDSGSQVQQQAYPAPGRSIETYAVSVGLGASLDAFLAQARLQSRTNWRREFTADAVNEYIRAGFGLGPP